MKKLLNKLSVASIVVASFTASCEKDYLETAPTTAVASTAVFATVEDAEKALNGMYRSFLRQWYGSQALGGLSGNKILMDVLGEDLVLTGQSNGWWISEYRWLSHRNISNTVAVRFNYLYHYTFVAHANQIIENIVDAAGDDAQRANIIAQAKALRAWAYFQMIQLYGERYVAGTTNSQLGVPLKLSTSTETLPRNTVEEVYTQINQDLDEAIAGLTTSRKDGFKAYININVAKGLKARVALTQQNYTVAAQMASEARQGFPLMTPEQYMEGFNSVANPEWMWGVVHPVDHTTYFYSFFAYMSVNFNSTNIRTNPKAIFSVLYDQISATDIRKQLWDPTGADTDYDIPPGGQRHPYINRKFRATSSTISTGDVVIMRAAEMYLIEAEALANIPGRESDAQDVLFELVSSRDPDYVKSTNTGQALIDEILLQRRIELWGEGFRFYDLKRLNQPLDRSGGNHNGTLTGGTTTVPAGDMKWQFLLPEREVLYSLGVVEQNPM